MQILSSRSFAAESLEPTRYVSDMRLDGILDRVRANGIAVVSGFPAAPEALLNFGRRIGTPSRKPVYSEGRSTARAGPFEHVGDVREMTEIPRAERRPTQDCCEIRMHTARSFAINRPRYLMLLMAEPSRRTDSLSGASTYAFIDRVFDVMHQQFPETCPDDIAVLSQTRVPWALSHSPDIVADSPLIWSTSPVRFRYWEGILREAAENSMPSPFVAALGRFDAAINNVATLTELLANRGDLVIIDNDRVAHGRRAFQPAAPASDGARAHRQVYSLHVFGTGQQVAE